MPSERVRVLLVDENATPVSRLVRYLEELGCHCSFVRSYKEASSWLAASPFDLVLSKINMAGGTAYGLRGLLLGRPTSLFYSHAVEDGCWWIPGVRQGSECWGEPALRPADFFHVLEDVVNEITESRRRRAPMRAAAAGSPPP
jgi:hypothetical protein